MSFIRDYMTYVECNEAHQRYHLWSCLITLSSIVGKKVWVERTYETVDARLYVVLVGQAGNRKTTARNVAQDIMRELGVPFSAECMSAQQLIHEMEESTVTYQVGDKVDGYAPMTCCVSELKEFLSVDPERMIGFLTDVYDQKAYDYGVRKEGRRKTIVNPYLCLLAGGVDQWICTNLKEGLMAGGFFRRTVAVYETTHTKSVVKRLPPHCVDAYRRLLVRGRQIKELAGEIKMTKEASDWFDHWYLNLKIPADPLMASWYESKQTMLVKVAIDVSVSETNDLVITRPMLELSLRYLDEVEVNMPKLFAGSGRNELGPVAMKLQDMLEHAKRPVLEKDVLVVMFKDCRDLREMQSVIEHVVRTGKVKRFTLPSSSPGQQLPNQKWYLCAASYVPPEVLEPSSQRVATTASGSSASGSQSPVRASAPAELDALLQGYQQTAPSASVGTGAQPQTASPSPEGTQQPPTPSP